MPARGMRNGYCPVTVIIWSCWPVVHHVHDGCWKSPIRRGGWDYLLLSITESGRCQLRVQRVVMPETGFESWTLLGDDQLPVEPVERFLAYLASIEKSPNTIRAYAHDLKDWFTYLDGQRGDWRSATLEDVAGFVAWLRLPPRARDGKVSVLPTVEHHCSAASVNRKLASLTSFCGFHTRHGVELTRLLVVMQPAGRRGGSATAYKPFLHHVAKLFEPLMTKNELYSYDYLRRTFGLSADAGVESPYASVGFVPDERALVRRRLC